MAAKKKATRSVPSMSPGQRGFDTAADKILAALELAEMPISTLSRISGVPRVGLSNWLNGNRPLRADYLMRVLDALGLAITRR